VNAIARTRPIAVTALAAALLLPAAAHARSWSVPATAGAAARVVAAASAGDTVVLERGRHEGPLLLSRPVTLRGEDGAILEGPGAGSVVEVTAAGTTIEDLEVRSSGRRVITVDAGIRVLSAANVTVRRVRMNDVLYGLYAERAVGLRVEGCRFAGRVAAGQGDGEGNGIHLWYSPQALLTGNDVSHFEDAVYLSFADNARAASCTLHDNGRYGFHTMYCQGNQLEQNTFTRNAAGCAIMFSNHLHVAHNRFIHNRGPRTYGLLLRDCSDGTFVANRLIDNTIGAFLDNSNRNHVESNLIQDNGWGVLLFSSCAGNRFAGNAFIHNDYPVALDMKYTDNAFDDGRRGNYWSENTPYDLDSDGLSDAAYSPVGTFAFLSKQYPDLSVLAKSPAVAALSVAEQVIPALRPSEAVDRHPLVTPPRELSAEADRVSPAGARSPWAAAAMGSIALLSLAGLGLGRRNA
jgi:nitrous oxidase accessory protein